MTQNSEFDYVRLSEREISAFIDAWEDAFGRKLDQEIYDWLFKDPNKIYVALDNNNNKITAGYCLFGYQAFLIIR